MVNIRLMGKKDINAVMDELLRLKRLNSEFDFALKVSSGNESEIINKLNTMIDDKENHIILVAEDNDKIVGILISDIIFRIYYDPKYEVRIREFYVMPEYRGKDIGKALINKLSEIAQKKDIKMITAEFPSLNVIAINFYKIMGFKELIKIYSKME